MKSAEGQRRNQQILTSVGFAVARGANFDFPFDAVTCIYTKLSMQMKYNADLRN